MGNHRWTAADLPSFEGRTVVITGANSGLGLETARELARAGAWVILAVRDVQRGRAAVAGISGITEVRPLDLADLSSVRRFADSWDGDIDVLINNAGIMLVPEGRTRDHFETHMGVNHFGHFALTALLLPRITDRVVTVSSQAHRRSHLALDDPNWESRPYSPAGAYAQSKLANLLFTLALQRRLTASGRLSVAAHPGWAATNLQSHSGSRLLGAVMRAGNALIAQDAASGALPTLFAASRALPPASYIGPNGFYEYRGHPTLVGRSPEAADPDLAEQLWTLSEQLTGITCPAGT
ncbi:oxidoreductase [Nocardia transvalensis]|uniref:oxidoreductase n=1 Tax=Nocardia transvalensis TaxID=37333 RepID=UPI00189382C9|nr:oxidoreductase [Nocardia transvalensis]MBF6327255.1 SDR family NAD(P)-dependent oxidoreductase [Nocardia transvalensis]